MKEVIRKIIRRMFPEIVAGYHLPKYAVVTAIPDMDENGGVADPFRPHYAVNLQLLDEHLQVDKDQPELEAVPVSLPGAGLERGMAALPQPGAVVELAWAYGKQSLPFVRSVMPFRMSLPGMDADSMVWQQSHNAFQKVDGAGNWTRQTNGDINDDCRQYVLECIDKLQELTNEVKEVAGSSRENIKGTKQVTAGCIKLLTAGSAHTGAAVNNNLTAGSSMNLAAGLNSLIKTGGNHSVQTTANVTRLTGGNVDDTAAGYQSIKGLKIWLGSPAENVLRILSEFMQSTTDALTTLSSHTHPDTASISEGDQVQAKATEISNQKDRLDIIKL